MITNDPAAPAPQPAPTTFSGVSRRGLFALAGAASAVAASPGAARTWGSGFTHSVASGEPHSNRVLLWTRFVGDAETVLDWEVSESADFTRIVSGGKATASPGRDWCAKAIAGGLEPDRWYYYRFIAPGGATSDIGRTRTLPEGPTSRFRLAVFSCSNFGFGWFNAYAHAAEANDCDLAVHLGDYIYEYGRGTYPAPGEAHPDRTLAPNSEIVTLADYRTRYATYRADPDLRSLHRSLPMIALWDDHESANDSWKDGAENHQSETEGSWEARKAIAKKVYREWMPVSDEPYAAYEIGDLATIFRLDTRLEGREEQLDFGTVLEGVRDPESAMRALVALRDGAWSDPSRQLLGAAQESWLADRLAASRARGAVWQVLAQQVLMGNLRSPAALTAQVEGSLPDFVRQRIAAAAMASEAGLPLNMDAWDGYPAARERVFEAALAADANLFVLAGDTHNGWAFELDHEGAKVGVELGVCSVSSPGFESYLSFVEPGDLAGALVAENRQLQWADTSQRGYMTVELTPARATTEFRFTQGVRTRSTRLAGTKRVVSEAGSHALEV